MAVDLDTVREEFPHLKSCTYLNSATVGISWRGQGVAAARFYDEAKALGFDGSGQWHDELRKCRKLVADLLRVAPDEVYFVGSTSEALHLTASAVPLDSHAQVVIAEDEFPAVAQSWAHRISEGAEIVRVPIPSETERSLAIVNAISARTRVVCVSHVHFSTGTRVDLAAISCACRYHGARLVVDGVQAMGAIDTDAALVDAYAASTFKWLLSAFGLAILVVRQPFAEILEPTIRGYSNPFPSRGLIYGHQNYPAIYALTATLEHLSCFGWDEIYSRVRHLSGFLDRRLREAGFAVITPSNGRAGIVSIAHPNPEHCVRKLAEKKVRVAERLGLVRISPHFYNTEDEIARCVALLRESVG
jgi:selenocysteine lyase/cysteine desulfurase